MTKSEFVLNVNIHRILEFRLKILCFLLSKIKLLVLKIF